MTWTNPVHVVAGTPVNASAHNAQVIDNLTDLRTAKVTRVGIIGTPTIPNATWTTLTWNFATYNTDGAWVAGLNPSRIKPLTPGYYSVRGYVSWLADPGAAGFRRAQLLVSGAHVIDLDTRPGANNYQNNVVQSVHYFDGGLYVEVQAYQTSGAGLDLVQTPVPSYLELTWEGA